ncbi:MAG: twin-arginine translocase TatA/TatE family subunit [Alphaproteobacteria bacterium]
MPSALEFVLILLAVAVLFGSGRLPKLMGDLGRSVRRSRTIMTEAEADPHPHPTPVVPRPALPGPEAR